MLVPYVNSMSSMKIIYATDIHEAYKTVQNLLRMTDADLYILAGDLLYSAFSSWDMAARFTDVQQSIFSWGASRGIAGRRYDIARHILENPATTADERALAQRFLDMTDLARRTMLGKYERFARIFRASGKTAIITIPGNYDMDLAHTALQPWDLHKKSISLQGLRISGYGGAPVFTPGIPDDLRVSFSEQLHDGRLTSEPYAFFMREKPDMILLHHPPYGYLDTLSTYGSIGSIGIRDFIDQSEVSLVLSGHMHGDWGAVFRHGKVFINPSNFGRVVEINRIKRGGYFAEFYVAGKAFTGGMLRQIEGNRIVDVEQCVLTGGKFRLLVMDLKRYRYLSNIKKRQKHIRAIRLFNRLRGFFQKYETAATRTRIAVMEQLAQALEDEGHAVAFHLLGSLNFGMAEDTSDIDIVVYFRDEQLAVPDDVAYPVPDYVTAKLEELKARGLGLSICDCLNLARIEEAIRREDTASLLLQRFIFYYTTCRCVHAKFIKEVENMLMHKQAFRFKMENELQQVFRMMISSFRHAFSFKKYQMRLQEKGMTVPPYIEELIWEYLEYRDEKGGT